MSGPQSAVPSGSCNLPPYSGGGPSSAKKSRTSNTNMTGKTSPGCTTQNSLLKRGNSQSCAPDHVQTAVCKYLLRRRYGVNYSDTFKRLTAPPIKTQSLRQMALYHLVHNESSGNDCIQFAVDGSLDPRIVEQQYAKFKLWISESPDYYKPELAQLLYPMFTHLYLQLVTSGKKTEAQKFHKKHQSTFLGNAEFAQFIRLLTPVTTEEELYGDDVVSAYHNSR